jgi:hypothetical protein
VSAAGLLLLMEATMTEVPDPKAEGAGSRRGLMARSDETDEEQGAERSPGE